MSETIIIKAGTDVVSKENGEFNIENMHSIANQIYLLRQEGVNCILVSSGAVGTGARKLGLNKDDLGSIEQSLASTVGQAKLITAWGTVFETNDLIVGQGLLTSKDFERVESVDYFKSVIEVAHRLGVQIVLNENDFTSGEELRKKTKEISKFGDNDALAKLVAQGIGARKLFIVSSVDGLILNYKQTNEQLIKTISINEFEMARSVITSDKSKGGRKGGMVEKINSIEGAVQFGIETFLIGRDHISEIIKAYKGQEFFGTRFKV
jgi:glutamate 5-kinase